MARKIIAINLNDRILGPWQILFATFVYELGIVNNTKTTEDILLMAGKASK